MEKAQTENHYKQEHSCNVVLDGQYRQSPGSYYEDFSISLAGFGIDSFIEVISAMTLLGECTLSR